MSTPIVFLDTETTSLRHDRRAWEIAMIRREVDGTEAETHLFVDVSIANADRQALAIGGYFDRHPKHADPQETADCGTPQQRHFVSEGAAAREVARLTQGAHLVGSNPAFDAETLSCLLRDHGHLPMWHHHLIDIGPLLIGYRCGVTPSVPIEMPYRVPDLALCAGIPLQDPDTLHTALGDARWVRTVYDAIVGRGERSGRGRHQ